MYPDHGEHEHPHGWAVEFCGDTLTADGMTASEQMFFLSAPLAHVLAYEERLIGERRRRAAHLTRSRRLHAL